MAWMKSYKIKGGGQEMVAMPTLLLKFITIKTIAPLIPQLFYPSFLRYTGWLF